ncbi:MAG TPA: hypothetical protein VKH81_06240 [Candidatus Angelobacter sp.]|nr:hypothetical protein [Candidatus Angelobacter sp.]
MKCEICKTIERLGLDDSAHDLWYCPDASPARTAIRHCRSYLQQITRPIALFTRAYRIWAHQRLVTLGL